ncbi:XdhC/CoxI family protein [Erwinia sp. CPCC 100877]|nr:XdhC/CoxI family protein [Erwinia sp. CPCC 100877]
MKEFFQALKAAFDQKKDTVLVTVVTSSGSTPRAEGAHMLIGSQGRIIGTIGGGAVEFQSEQLAAKVLKHHQPVVKKFILAPNKTDDIGMICGGNTEVLFQFIPWKAAADFEEIYTTAMTCFKKNQAGWLICTYDDHNNSTIAFYSQDGFIGLAEELPQLLFNDQIQKYQKDQTHYYIEPILKPGKVYVFGGGHVGQALVPILKSVDFHCVVFEDRQEFLRKELFPLADELVFGDFHEVAKKISLTQNDYCIIVTRGHSFDYALEEQLIRAPHYYLGVVGSEHKVAIHKKKLLEQGFSAAEIATVDMPIGLNIPTETPAEIAISIVGKLIDVRANK